MVVIDKKINYYLVLINWQCWQKIDVCFLNRGFLEVNFQDSEAKFFLGVPNSKLGESVSMQKQWDMSLFWSFSVVCGCTLTSSSRSLRLYFSVWLANNLFVLFIVDISLLTMFYASHTFCAAWGFRFSPQHKSWLKWQHGHTNPSLTLTLLTQVSRHMLPTICCEPPNYHTRDILH